MKEKTAFKSLLFIGITSLIILISLFFNSCSMAPQEPPETIELNGSIYELEYVENFNRTEIIERNDWGSTGHNSSWFLYRADWGESKAKNKYHLWANYFEDDISLEEGALKIKTQVDHKQKVISGGTVFSNQKFLMKDAVFEIRFKVPKTLNKETFAFLLNPIHKNSNVLDYNITKDIRLYEITPIEIEYKMNRFRVSETIWNKARENEIEERENYLSEEVVSYYTGEYSQNVGYVYFDENFYNEWHTLQYVWEDNEVIEYLDGIEVVRKEKSEELKMIKDNELYGVFDIGAGSLGECFGVVDVNNFQSQNYYVDYVKVWRKAK